MAKQPSPLKPWQWAEILAGAIVIWAQVLLSLVGHPVLAALVGVVTLALVIHCLSWMVPLYRESWRQRSGRR